MKRIILSATLICCFLIANAQKNDVVYDRTAIPFKDGKIEYIYIDTVKGLDKNQIFIKLTEWIALNFKNSKNVVQLSDKESGKIIIKGSLQNQYLFRMFGGDTKFQYNLFYTINITIKDDRYRLVFDDLRVEQTGASNLNNNLVDLYVEMENPKVNKSKATRSKQILVNTNADIIMFADEMLTYLKKSVTNKDDF